RTKELMWFAGLMARDGCIVKSFGKPTNSVYYKLKLGMKSKKAIQKTEEIISSFGLNGYISKRKANPKDLFVLELGSNLLAFLLFPLGLKCKNKSKTIEVGKPIFELPPELVHAYLEGVFEGDGNFNRSKTGAVVRIVSCSKKFALGLHFLFSRMGYHNNVKTTTVKPSKLIPKVSKSKVYFVTVTGQNNLKNFFLRIPEFGEKSGSSAKIMDSMPRTSFSLPQFEKFLHWEDIESIRKIKTKKPVYNLTLESDPNNFVVGNVIVHNCGRSGHRLHDTVKGRIVVLDRDDLVECAVLLKNALEQHIDTIDIPQNCLDVLAQQIFGIAINSPTPEKDVFALVRHSYCYRNLSKLDFDEVIKYLSGHYSSLETRHVYAKIWFDEQSGMIGKRGKLARVLYMTNIGTIPDEAKIAVKIGIHAIGTIDEIFLEHLRPNDVFVLGGQSYVFKFSRGNTAQVAPAYKRPPTVPSWFSEMLPLSIGLAVEIQKFRSLMEEKFRAKKTKKEIIEFINSYLYVDKNSANAIFEYFREQFLYSKIPVPKKLIIEYYSDYEKRYAIFHALYGRRVNDALSRVFAYLLGRLIHKDIEIVLTDNGFVLAAPILPMQKALSLLEKNSLRDIAELAIENSEIMGRRFRHCATRALMILRSYKGKTKTVGRQQMHSRLLLYAVKRIGREFPILKETRREILEDLMDIKNAEFVVDKIKSKAIKIVEINSDSPSPFAFNLFAQGYSDVLRMEGRIDFVKRMHEKVMKAIAENKKAF
ncbi:MAG: LAGLIDADG family homing endonuclease, partial [Candidatus ainarchaeum sp.]|nr:LAGLIDADG family homing endonuclease [Candidatus ainarchaeum sp.]